MSDKITRADRECLADLFDLPAATRARLLSDNPRDSDMTIEKLQRIAAHRIAAMLTAPTRANPTVAGVDAAGEGRHG